MVHIGNAKLALFNEIPNLYHQVILRSHNEQKKHIFQNPREAFEEQAKAKINPEELELGLEPNFDEILSSIFTSEILSNIKRYKETINSFIETLIVGQKTLTSQNLVIPNWGTNYQTFHKDALNFYNMALEVITPEYLNEWQNLQVCRGNYYRDCHDGEQNENAKIAMQYYQSSLRDVIDKSEHWIMVHYHIGVAYQKIGDYQNSKIYFENALSESIAQQLSFIVLLVAKELGDSASKNKDWLCAIDNYKLAIEEIEKIRKFTTWEDRRRELCSDSIPLYKGLVQAYFNADRIEEVIQYAELSRSSQVTDLIFSNYIDPDGSYSRDERLEFGLKTSQRMIDSQKQYTDWMKSENSAVYELTKHFYFPSIEGQNIYEAEAEIAETFKKIQFQIARKFEYELTKDYEKSNQLINLKEIQKLIPFPNSAFLQFYSTKESTYIFIIKTHSIDYHICEGDSLQSWIHDNWLLPYTSPLNQFLWKDKITDKLNHLAKAIRLNKLIEKLTDIEELVFLPHQYLHLIPFSALPVFQENGSYKSLVEYFAIRYVPSFRVLRLILERSCPSPDYRDNVGKHFGTVENATNDLDFSPFECNSIAQMLNIPNDQRLQGVQAHRDNFHRLVKKDNIQVLHLSHHAVSRPDNPIESYLLLSSTRIDLAYESLSLGHFLDPSWRMPNVSDVFLSCCETAVGDISETDDILSLGAGFLIAGANRVISTLWSVDDLATSLFSIMYYQERMAGRSCSQAVQSAQIKLKNLSRSQLYNFPFMSDFLNRLDDENMGYRAIITELFSQEYPFSNPYWWAAFTCQGIY